MLLTTLIKEVILDEISDKAKSQAKERFKKQDPNLTDEILDYYINIFSDKQSSNAFQKKDIMQYTFPELEKIVDANFSRKKTNIDVNDTNFEGSEDVIYNKNKLLILLGNLKEKCIRYGQGKSWCISRRDSSNMFFSYRMRLEEPVFYFVFDKEKPKTDKYHAMVIYVDNKDKYMVSDADNKGDKAMTWDEIEKIQPKLIGLKNLFKHIPLTEEEKEDYKKFKKPVSNETYENFNYDEREKYIGFLHDLTEEQIRMTWAIPNQKTLISKYVTTGLGANLPQDIQNKLPLSDKLKLENNRTTAIKNGIKLSDNQFESINDELKKYYIEITLKMLRDYSFYNFEHDPHKLTEKQLQYCDNKTKQEYLELLIDDSYFELSPYEIKILDVKLKIQYIKNNLSQGLNIDDKVLKSCPKEVINDYIEYCIEKSKSMSDYAFKLCTSDQKIRYVINTVKTGTYILTDEKFEWCPEELKKDYIKKHINFLKKKLSDRSVQVAMQVQWAKDRGLTESIKLMNLLK